MGKRAKFKEIHCFDIDGVLLDSSHRYKAIIGKDGKHKIDLNHWRENEVNCLQDSPLPMAETYKGLLLKKSAFVIIATSRIMKALDYKVIEEKLGYPHAFISRINNEQKGGMLKLRGLIHVINECNLHHIDSISIYEDNAEYLKVIADGIFQELDINPKAFYIPSLQGH